MYSLDVLITDSLASAREGTHLGALRAMKRLFASPSVALDLAGELREPGITTLHRSDDLTVLNVVWAAHAVIRPHNHETWAVIGVYAGREDNLFWRRVANGGGRIEAAGAKSLGPGDISPLGRHIIHSVVNPTDGLTGAIHIYGGDFFAISRSEWDPRALTEAPYDMAKTTALFGK